jgi:hypothetical protein
VRLPSGLRKRILLPPSVPASGTESQECHLERSSGMAPRAESRGDIPTKSKPLKITALKCKRHLSYLDAARYDWVRARLGKMGPGKGGNKELKPPSGIAHLIGAIGSGVNRPERQQWCCPLSYFLVMDRLMTMAISNQIIKVSPLVIS